MEGLLLAEVLGELAPLLPSERHAWRFVDGHTCVLPLAAGPALWFFYRPPNPRLELRDDAPGVGRSYGGFQDQLQARAAGPLLSAEQRQLDRVATFYFGSGGAFVERQAVALVFELTGRNCNLIVTRQGTILGAARTVGADRNRYRQVEPGRPYRPPPPYRKLDPRSAGEAELREALDGKTLAQLRSLVDGVGPVLGRTLAAQLGPDAEGPFSGAALDRAVAALKALAAAPRHTVAATVGLPDLVAVRNQERVAALREQVRKLLTKERKLLAKRLQDAERTVAAGETAERLRRSAELLMAYPQDVPAKAPTVRLQAFDGEPLEIALDPRLDAIGNAQRLYAQAKKREQRALAAAERRAEVAPRLRQLEELSGTLDAADEAELGALLDRYGAGPEAGPDRTERTGLRFRDPRGFEVVVGRNARENDTITFRLARSRDVWLHVQAFPGSHVLIRADGREVPFDTVLFAARLAAGHSKAGQDAKVAVDYTLKKNVWRVKGMAPGAANISRQKTVYVTPMRRPPTSGGAEE